MSDKEDKITAQEAYDNLIRAVDVVAEIKDRHIAELQAQLSAAQASVEDLKKAAKPTAAEAYQVIGALAEEAGLFDKPGVQQALDYFSDIANCGKTHRCRAILPWGIDGVEEQPEGGE